MGLEEEIAEKAEKYGWKVELRRKHGSRIQDLILKRGRLVLVLQVKDLSGPADPRAVTQTRRDYEEYIRYLLEEKLGVIVVPVLVARELSRNARKRAASYGISHYRPDEIDNLLR